MSSYSKMKAYASQAEYNGAASGIYDGKTAFDVTTITNPFIREGGRTVGSGRVATIIE